MSRQKNETCYERDFLQQYLVEELSEVDETKVRDHLNECAGCQREMELAAADHTMWESLRAHLSYEPTADHADARVKRLIEFLGPTDDPDMLGRLGKYEVVGLIGQGSTGIVVKALERRLNRFVAIKVLSPVYSSNGAARRRFEREGRAVAAVTDQHVVPIYAVDEFRGLPYIVMQYIPGVSLLQRFEKDGPLDTCGVTRIGLQVAKGLAAAHDQGIVHRDVKPANVLLEETVERAMVTDFGLARVADEASMTRSGTIAGTPQYMSPEQAKGEAVDPRSDLFSLGSLMYAACTARPPFRAETLFGVINRVCQSEPRPIREINPEIEEWLARFINRLISKKPEHRFQTADDVADALESELAFMQNPTVAPKPQRDWMPAPARRKPNAFGRVALATGLLGIVALGAFMFSENNRNWIASGFSSPEPKQEWVASSDQDEDNEVKTFWKANEVDWNTDSTPTFDQKIERSFDVEEGGTLTVKVGSGDVVVQPSELSDRVHVTVLRRVAATSQEEAELVIAKHELEVSAIESELLIAGNFKEGVTVEEADAKFKKLLYRVSVPRNFNHDLNTQEGSISIGAVAGDVNAETGNGCVDLARIDGDVNVTSNGGDVHLNEGATGEVDLFLVRGNAYVCDVDEKTRIRNSGGHIWIGGCKGEVRARTSGGNVKVTKVIGPTQAHTSEGDIVVNLVDSPTADAQFTATSGDVTVRVCEDVALSMKQIVAEGDENEDAEPGENNLIDQELNGGGSTIAVSSTMGNVELTVLSAEQAEGLGGSGLGGSGSGNYSKSNTSAEAIAKTKGEPRPGAIATIKLGESEGMDGYTLYLPESHGKTEEAYPILVYMQGAWGVGGDVENVNHWGLTRLIRDENDLASERNQLILDSFIVVSPHINGGQYYDDAELVQNVINEVAEKYNGDLDRVYATGVSRGGHGSWGIASKLPGTFAAIAPMGGDAEDVDDFGIFDNVAVWIGHNQGDTTVEYEYATSAVKQIEEKCDVQFLTIFRSDVGDAPYLENRHVLNAPPTDGHDVWTDVYTSVEFYKWLLAQRRSTSEPVASSTK